MCSHERVAVLSCEFVPLKENSCLKRTTMTVKLFYFIASELDGAFRNDL